MRESRSEEKEREDRKHFLYVITTFFLGPTISEVTQKLKEHNYTGNALFSSTIASNASSRNRSKPRSNSSPNIKGKQKASQENIPFPDDGKYITGLW